MAEWVHAVERAYVASATGGGAVRDAPGAAARRTDGRASANDPDTLRVRAHAAAGAVASHYLAVGTPRSLGLVISEFGKTPDAVESLVAHRTWFAPTDIRCAATHTGADELAVATGGRVVSVEQAFAADIVCVHGASIRFTPAMLRRGTHVNLLGYRPSIDDELARIAMITHETPGLGALAAGLIDGRQLDEITVFVIGDAAVALGALAE